MSDFKLSYEQFHALKPWETEPDEIKWDDENTGYLCFAFRGEDRAWRGYVCVDKSHFLYQKRYDSLVLKKPFSVKNSKELNEIFYDCDTKEVYMEQLSSMVEVHWGITFSDFITALAYEINEEDKELWGFGFDCTHCDDISITTSQEVAQAPLFEVTYKTLEYVKNQCEKMAKQLFDLDKSEKEIK